MNAFEYVAPASAADAVRALAGHDQAAALAGGTDLLNRIKDSVSQPSRVVYIRDLKDLAGIASGAGLTLGASTSLAQIVANPVIAEQYPALRQAAHEIGTPQIRNMATLGGNLLQRPRCWYFRSGFGLLGKGADGSSNIVREGDNRYAAIFMTSGDALYVNPSSLAPPLIALEATATLVGPDGERTVPVADLYTIPKNETDLELALKPGELLSSVQIPPAKGKNASYEVRWKQSHDWPLALASVALTMQGESVGTARVILGSVAPVPYRSGAAEAALTGKALSRDTAAAAAAAAVAEAKPLSMNAYKVQITKTALQRALLTIAGDRYWEA